MGRRISVEVAQFYLGLPSNETVPQLPKRLKGFERVDLAPGQSSQVKLSLGPRSLLREDQQA